MKIISPGPLKRMDGASIDANGVITWPPTETQGPSTNLVTPVVSDTNTNAVNAQHLSATNFFTVVVNDIHARTTYDLRADFSTNANPNGVWSYNEGVEPITCQVTDGQCFAGWSWRPSCYGSIIRWLTYQHNDFHDQVSGDVQAHSLSAAYGGASKFVGITWTSPSTGYATVRVRAWHIWDSGDRDSSWTLSMKGALVAQRNSVLGLFRTNTAAQFECNLVPGETLNLVSVRPGDRIEWLTQARTYSGHGVGVDITVTLSTTAPDQPPRMAAVQLDAQNRMHFEIVAFTNAIVEVQARSTLPDSDWSAIGVITNLVGRITFTDPDKVQSQRYYRLKQIGADLP